MAQITISSDDDLDALLRAEDTLRTWIRERITAMQDAAETKGHRTTRLVGNASRQLYSPQSVAKKLGISRDQVVQACNAGELRCFSVPVPGGTGRKIALDDAWAWFKGRYGGTRR